MPSAVTVSQLQAEAPRLVRQAERDGMVVIFRKGRTVAFLVSREKMASIFERMKIVGSVEAMKDISCLDEDEP